MPNFKKHATTGGVVGLTFVALTNLIQQNKRAKTDPNYKFDWAEFILKSLAGGGVGAFCGVLPDLLEPATCPNHRKLFHSVTTASLISYGLYKANTSSLSSNDKEIINIAGAGYLSHLLLDSETEFGLPLVA